MTLEWVAQDRGHKVGHAEDRPRHTVCRVALCRVSCRHRCVRRLCWALRLVVDRCVCVPGSVVCRDGPVSAASPTVRAGVVVVAEKQQPSPLASASDRATPEWSVTDRSVGDEARHRQQRAPVWAGALAAALGCERMVRRGCHSRIRRLRVVLAGRRLRWLPVLWLRFPCLPG